MFLKIKNKNTDSDDFLPCIRCGSFHFSVSSDAWIDWLSKSIYCDLFLVKIRQPDNFIGSFKRLKFTHGCFILASVRRSVQLKNSFGIFESHAKMLTHRGRGKRPQAICEWYEHARRLFSTPSAHRIISSRLKKTTKKPPYLPTYRPRMNFQKKPETHILFFFGLMLCFCLYYSFERISWDD